MASPRGFTARPSRSLLLGAAVPLLLVSAVLLGMAGGPTAQPVPRIPLPLPAWETFVEDSQCKWTYERHTWDTMGPFAFEYLDASNPVQEQMPAGTFLVSRFGGDRSCVHAVGTVVKTVRTNDGDFVFDLQLDVANHPEQAILLENSTGHVQDVLHVEIVCRWQPAEPDWTDNVKVQVYIMAKWACTRGADEIDPTCTEGPSCLAYKTDLPTPCPGQTVDVVGRWVEDLNHDDGDNHPMEIHPASSVKILVAPPSSVTWCPPVSPP